MKRLTNVVQIIAVLLTAFFVVCLFTSSFPPWSSDDDGAGAAPNTTVAAAGTTAAGTGTTAGGTGTTAGDGAVTTAVANDVDGQPLYDDNCASCHKDDGSGGFGPSLQGIGDRFSDDEIAGIIANGQGSMPGFGGELSSEEIAAIVAYTKTFG